MLNHPHATEGRALYDVIYPTGDAPAGLAPRLRKRGTQAVYDTTIDRFAIGVMLHGLADEAERRARKVARKAVRS